MKSEQLTRRFASPRPRRHGGRIGTQVLDHPGLQSLSSSSAGFNCFSHDNKL